MINENYISMRHPTAYTFLGFYFNALVDGGHHLDLSETHLYIRDKGLFNWLMDQFSDELDISLFTSQELDKIESFFQSLSIAVDEERKMGVKNNGLCLLVAYCFEGAQRKEENLY